MRESAGSRGRSTRAMVTIAPLPQSQSASCRSSSTACKVAPGEAGPCSSVSTFRSAYPALTPEALGSMISGAFLSTLDRTSWRQFFSVAERPEDISVTRPFYPAKAGKRGSVARRHLLQGLGLASYQDLLRVCDRASEGRPAACAIFWTLGPQQVVKAAIVGWRDLLIPALDGHQDLALWPFDGELNKLLGRHGVVAAETYPAEVYAHLGLWPGNGRRRESKRLQVARTALAPRFLELAGSLGLRLEPSLREAIADGFGPSPDGEDPFDAIIGLLGMVNVALGRRSPGTPRDPEIRRIEGWILGQEAAA